MTTWAQFLTDVRNDLQDTKTENPRWSDDVLYLYTKDGIRDYSIWFPNRIDHVKLSLTDGKYPLPLNFIDEILVECPEETFLERRNLRPGVTFSNTNKAQFYYISGGGLYLSSATTDGLFLTYYATHDVPASKSDDTFVFTVPDADMELIRLFVKAKALGQLRARQSNLDRFKVGSGKRDDNPLEPETQNLMEEYQYGISTRLKGKLVVLTKMGRGA